MRRILLATLILCVTLVGMSGSAFAGGLGPIVLGKPRTEPVLFCFKNNTLGALIDFEEKSVAEDIAPETRLNTIRKYARENQCWVKEMRYTPQKILRIWISRDHFASSSASVALHALVESTTMLVIEGQVTSRTIYVISHDPPVRSD